MNWLKKRLKSRTIWLTSIAPSALAFMSMYDGPLKEILQGKYEYVFLVFAALAWRTREVTNKSLDDK
jgi:hypothetical protein